MLSVSELTVAYGGVRAVSSLGMEVSAGTVHGLIGPNGAGKSTAINAMSGVVRPERGSVVLDGVELVGRNPSDIVRNGLARTFQQARLWAGMTVAQNLTVPLLKEGRRKAETRAKEMAELLDFAALFDLPASELPFGMRRLVEVGRAMMTDPKVILLDEPGAGLTHLEKAKLIDVLNHLATGGTAVVLVDHDMDLIMQASSKVTVLDAGAVIFEGTPQAVREDERVLNVYLGTES
jgi:branched-chain amino acid transport system ATP-binding protein